MKEELIADLWTVVVEHIPERHRKNVAADFVNTLVEYNTKDDELRTLIGIDSYLDTAIHVVVDDIEIDTIVDEEE